MFAIYVLPGFRLWGYYVGTGVICKVSDDTYGDSFRKEYIEFMQSFKKCHILIFKSLFPLIQ